jgi:hypothetical protein
MIMFDTPFSKLALVPIAGLLYVAIGMGVAARQAGKTAEYHRRYPERYQTGYSLPVSPRMTKPECVANAKKNLATKCTALTGECSAADACLGAHLELEAEWRLLHRVCSPAAMRGNWTCTSAVKRLRDEIRQKSKCAKGDLASCRSFGPGEAVIAASKLACAAKVEEGCVDLAYAHARFGETKEALLVADHLCRVYKQCATKKMFAGGGDRGQSRLESESDIVKPDQQRCREFRDADACSRLRQGKILEVLIWPLYLVFSSKGL